LKIVVLLKQVRGPREAEGGVDFATDRARNGKQLNPADKSALLMAVDLKKKHGAEITCLTMGPPSAKEILREAAMEGVDRICLITDPLYAGSDTLATSLVLASALRYIGSPELVLCGRRTIDGETGQVGPQTAVHLGYPCVTNVLSLEIEGESKLSVKRLLEIRIEKLLVPLPAMICVCETHALNQLPDIFSIRRASKMQIEILSNTELRIPPEECGLSGSPTRVLQIHRKSMEKRNTRFAESSTQGAELFLSYLKKNPS
jgi:electron transfer flavoprotein beta subunit